MKKKYIVFIIVLILILILIKSFNRNNTKINVGDATYYYYEVDDDIDDGVISEANMDFVNYENMGVKMESLKISEINVELSMNFKVGEIKNANSFEYCAAIYDSNGSVYMFFYPYKEYSNELKEFYKKRNIDYNERWGNNKSIGCNKDDLTVDSYENGIITTTIKSFSMIGYGNSTNPSINKPEGMASNLFIEIWKRGENSSFIIELKLPKEFYKNSCIHYAMKEKEKDFYLKTAICDDKSFLFVAGISDFYDLYNNSMNSVENGRTRDERFNKCFFEEIYNYLYITDENGKRYNLKEFNDSEFNSISIYPVNELNELGEISVRFNITTNDNLTDKLYVHIVIDDEDRIFEITRQY